MTIKMKSTVILRSNATGMSHSRTDVTTRDVGLVIDEPLERNGTNLGPTPTDTALAALLGCTHVIGNKCAHRLGLDIGTLNIEARCDFDRRGVTLQEEIEVPFPAIKLVATCSNSIPAEDLARLGAEVAKFCPLAKLFQNAGTNLQVDWVSN